MKSKLFKKIVICDDNHIELINIEKALKDNFPNVEVVVFDEGEKVVEYAKNHFFDLLIADIKMPIMSGLTLSEIIKKLSPNTEIIIVSAFSEFEYARQALVLGVKNYLTKPLEISKFINIVAKIIGENIDIFHDILKSILRNNSGFSDITDEIINEVKQNFGKSTFSIQFLCQKLFLSQTYISSIFKRDTGTSLAKFINLFRLEYAKYLIVNTKMNMKGIMQSVGFISFSHFCSNFKKQFAISPTELRDKS